MTVEKIYTLLDQVKDPEIPVLSIVDLGVITNVEVNESGVVIEMTPTFTGCPAIDVMKSEIREVLEKNGVNNSRVNVSYREAWSSDKISEKGKEALRKFGLAPPPAMSLFHDLDILEHAICPRCTGTDTELKTLFGSTLCRSIHFCNSCSESFEQFKPL
jgi:ring-1,2-phenylacetyl-CoA epoxidase subunit PaaD